MNTFCIEQFVGKIKAPCVVRIGDEEMSFESDEELVAFQFDKRYLIE